MSDTLLNGSSITRAWFINVIVNEVRVRCYYRRVGKRIVQYTVQLELFIGGEWRPVIRYDNAHGFSHRDEIHPDGKQDKFPVYYGNANETFTQAIGDLTTNWQKYQARYLEEMQS